MSCLIYNKTKSDSDDVIKLLFAKQDVRKDASIGSFWHIKNKYYSAQVKILVQDKIGQANEDDDVRAVIHYACDVSSEWEAELNAWHKALFCDVTVNQDDDDERIKMVVYQSLQEANESVVDQLKSWALSKSVELVDLSEPPDHDQEIGSPFHTGNNRVVDALTAYAGWPPPTTAAATSASSASADEGEKKAESEEVEAGNGGEDDPTFEQLFSQLSKFRESAESLPNDQRKALAEELAIAFYSAIGGGDSDESEDDGNDATTTTKEK